MTFERRTHKGIRCGTWFGDVAKAVRWQNPISNEILLGLEHGGEDCQSLSAISHRSVEAAAAEDWREQGATARPFLDDLEMRGQRHLNVLGSHGFRGVSGSECPCITAKDFIAETPSLGHKCKKLVSKPHLGV